MITIERKATTEPPVTANKTCVGDAHQPLIVVVEDDEMAARGIELQLGLHFQLKFFKTAEDGLAYILGHAEVIDLIILDYMLPGMSGLELLAIIKRDASLKHLKVILQSGACYLTWNADDVTKPDFYLQKPWNRMQMRSAIARALGFPETF